MINPKVIYLEPSCLKCQYQEGETGRQWCEDDIWEKCSECGVPSVKYILKEDND